MSTPVFQANSEVIGTFATQLETLAGSFQDAIDFANKFMDASEEVSGAIFGPAMAHMKTIKTNLDTNQSMFMAALHTSSTTVTELSAHYKATDEAGAAAEDQTYDSLPGH